MSPLIIVGIVVTGVLLLVVCFLVCGCCDVASGQGQGRGFLTRFVPGVSMPPDVSAESFGNAPAGGSIPHSTQLREMNAHVISNPGGDNVANSFGSNTYNQYNTDVSPSFVSVDISK